MTTNPNGSFAGKVAFVTGAGSGIGRATALAFARGGASVVVADVTENANRETARMIEDFGGQVLAVTCDVTQAGDVRRAVEAPAEELYEAPTDHRQDGPDRDADRQRDRP